MQVDAMSDTMSDTKNRDYYVKLDNIFLENIAMHGYKHISASSGPDLLRKVIAYYGFNNDVALRIQLWSSNNRLSKTVFRLDTMDVIPENHEFIWVRGA